MYESLVIVHESSNNKFMVRSIFLLLIVFLHSQSNAQQLDNEKKTVTGLPVSQTGFKKQNSSSVVTKKNIPKNSVVIPGQDLKGSVNTQNSNPGAREELSKSLEIIRIDYNNMPADVQLKISHNKALGKYELEGINKVFTVEIKSCLTDADRKKILSFLKAKKGYINSQLVSAGVVKIVVEPTFDSGDLKNAMAAEGIHFNFLNRSYLLKN